MRECRRHQAGCPGSGLGAALWGAARKGGSPALGADARLSARRRRPPAAKMGRNAGKFKRKVAEKSGAGFRLRRPPAQQSGLDSSGIDSGRARKGAQPHRRLNACHLGARRAHAVTLTATPSARVGTAPRTMLRPVFGAFAHPYPPKSYRFLSLKKLHIASAASKSWFNFPSRTSAKGTPAPRVGMR